MPENYADERVYVVTVGPTYVHLYGPYRRIKAQNLRVQMMIRFPGVMAFVRTPIDADSVDEAES